jgi:hypothetical protein
MVYFKEYERCASGALRSISNPPSFEFIAEKAQSYPQISQIIQLNYKKMRDACG